VSGRYDWGLSTEPEPGLHGRSIRWPRGRVLGGSGSINGLAFLRGSPRDYDRWAQAGARGWSWEEVVPYFRRLEDWRGPAGETRGRGGPLPVERTGAALARRRGLRRRLRGARLPAPARRQRRADRGRGADPAEHARRPAHSTARAYLRPARRGRTCASSPAPPRTGAGRGRPRRGVLARRGGGGEERFLARREVVLCAGAIASPQLLMLSGIGDAQALRAMGIGSPPTCPASGATSRTT
jgi:choline dehydrogenase